MTRRTRSIRRACTEWPRTEPGASRCRALIVGIAGENDAPSDALNTREDVALIAALLTEQCGYKNEDIIIMTDSPNTPKILQPTRQNLKRQLRSLVKGARRGDRHFLFYAGHGVQRKCEEGSDESDGMDECIKCADGLPLVDNWLRKHVVDPLPAGSSLFALFDACHAGTLLDLPHRKCNQSYSIALALHRITRLNRSLMSLPTSISSLSSPHASPTLSAQELPQTPSRSPLGLTEDLVTSPTALEPHSPIHGSLLFSSPISSMASSFPATPLLLSSSLPPQSTISMETLPLLTPEPSEKPHELTLEIPSSWGSPMRNADDKCTGLCSPVEQDGPLIISLASTADNELSFERSDVGGPMTGAFVDTVRAAGGNLTYESLMLRLRDRFADLNLERYIELHKYRGSLPNFGDYEQPQCPQLSSLYPLDMETPVIF